MIGELFGGLILLLIYVPILLLPFVVLRWLWRLGSRR